MSTRILLCSAFVVFTVLNGVNVKGDDPIARKYHMHLVAMKKAHDEAVAKAKQQAIQEYKQLQNQAMNKHNLKKANAIQKKIDQLEKGNQSPDQLREFFDKIANQQEKEYDTDPDEVAVGDKRKSGQNDTNGVKEKGVPKQVTGMSKSGDGKPANEYGEMPAYKLEYVGQKEQKRNMNIMKQLENNMGIEDSEDGRNKDKNWIEE